MLVAPPHSRRTLCKPLTLSVGNGTSSRCSSDNTLSGGKNQFCINLSIYRSAAIAICTTLMQKVDCGKISEIVAALYSKCEEEQDGEYRARGKVRMT